MKIITASNGKQTVKMSKVEWQSIGKKAGWITAWKNDSGKDEKFSQDLSLQEQAAAAINHARRLGWFDPEAAIERMINDGIPSFDLVPGVVFWEAAKCYPSHLAQKDYRKRLGKER